RGRIVNEDERVWQARDNDERQHNEADGPINQNRISRLCPTGALSRKQPNSRAVPAHCRGQYLIEEGRNEGDLQRRIEAQARVAYGGDFPPPRCKEHSLSPQQENCEGNPAPLEPTQSLTEDADIDPAQ